jgi:hypothetical protein
LDWLLMPEALVSNLVSDAVRSRVGFGVGGATLQRSVIPE